VVPATTNRVSARIYVVKPGDTLWGIATRVQGPAADPRPEVDRLIAANDIVGAALFPGQRLIIPQDRAGGT
jgi:LysM repeat protein